MRQPECPFCLEKHLTSKNGLICPNVKRKDDPSRNEEIPEFYITQYDKVPPIWLLTVGFSKHGKTCYTAALTLMLENLNRIWAETTYHPLDDYTRRLIRDTRLQAFKGDIPDHTDALRPLFINMYDVPLYKDNCLVIYDAPGELYEDLKSFSSNEISLRPLKKVKNIWFLVSLSELEENREKKINDLLSLYITGMQNSKIPIAGRNLIVVYTMADKIVNELSYAFPEEIKNYLMNDPFQNITDNGQIVNNVNASISDYIDDMKLISNKLEKYTIENVPGGGAFVKLARRAGMGLYFSINSALGTNPVNGVMKQDATRYRVLDPYLWALHLNKEEIPLPINMILDGSLNSDVVYDRMNILNVFNDLSDFGEVTTYVMGQVNHVSVADQAPPTKKPGIPTPRLIGPILEKLKFGEPIVIITTGKIEDLSDFSIADWGSRILIVKIGDEREQEWANQIVIREGDTSDLIKETFKRTFVTIKQGGL